MQLLNGLRRTSKILIAILGNQDIILDAHTANLPVLVQHALINELGVLVVLEVGLDDEVAEIDLSPTKYTLACTPCKKSI